MDCTVRGVEKSRTRLNDFHFHFSLFTFPGGSVVRNLPCNAGDAGLISGQGTKNPRGARQLSLRATPREKPVYCNEDAVCCN